MFKSDLAFGQIGESDIARWLRSRGHWVLPVYEKEIENGKGPRLFLPDGELIAPDMLVLGKEVVWVEAKHKTAFTWYRKGGMFQTGIDLRHYMDYLKVQDESPYDVWLLFLHRGGQAKDSPPSPSGLYGNALSYLRQHEDHRSPPADTHPGGMVYWNIDVLRLMASLDEIDKLSGRDVVSIDEQRRLEVRRRLAEIGTRGA